MGKIALLVSREEMLYQAHNILQEKKYEISEIRVVQTQDTIVEARQSIANGASIIIARGLQASLIKQYTDIPVVEIVLTAQEMALLVVKAKQIVKKPKPVIAVVGFKNMFCDMSYFDTLYDIELRTYYSDNSSGLRDASLRAVEEKADLIIGGDTAVEVATKAHVPSLFLSTTEDSLKTAFAMAESMDYAMG
ncbi:MAG: PrpR N-terminal domain-containing protein, partial [Clostridiaceae bacterium]|nr:PrpR N-terminal domain-containing protein [Clostridiaceae bacterium]